MRGTASGGRVLQYRRIEERPGFFAADLGQQSLLLRWSLYLLALALFVGLTYGAFLMTRTLHGRSQPISLDEEP